MKRRPTVTIITIFFNADQFLQEAIASACAQTHEDWEYLLVDDGSTDQSGEIARHWAELRPDKIRYLHHNGHQNLGMSATRNRGLEEAKGEFVAFLDADDVWLPNKLTEQVAIMAKQPRAAMLYGRTEIWFSWTGIECDRNRDHTLELGVATDTLVEPPQIVLLLLENKVQNPTTCSAFFRRKVLIEVGSFHNPFRGMFEDQAFFAKICLRFPVFVSSRCWARYRQHTNSCCALAEASGTTHSARLTLLRWMERYFAELDVTDARLWNALQKQLWPYQHPVRHRFITKVQRLRERLQKRGRSSRPELFANQ